GFGAIGELPAPLPLKDLIQRIKLKLGVKWLAVLEGPSEQITRLAVCGGSGGELVEAAFQQGADAFITGEAKYHTFLEYEDKLTIITAGHYATERVILPVWVERLQKWLGDEPISVIETKMLTNPIKLL
ncbi:MAG: Nif3-like dinuclear metal center hexameric protein, partial [bacterium]